MNIHWDAQKYKQDFMFVPEYGAAVLDLFALAEKFPEDYFLDHVHFAAAGSQALAEAIYQAGQALINKEE